MRTVLKLAYDGTRYHGWQIQDNAHSVQGELNIALEEFYEQPIDTTGCGRTDTGVHASQFFVHYDAPSFPDSIARRLNLILPADIRIQNAYEVADDFHVRFDAISRAYEYHVHFLPDPFHDRNSLLLFTPPDISQMNACASLLLDHTDYGCFGKNGSNNRTNICRISQAEWIMTGPEHWIFRIKADRFLRGMVRAIVGTLLNVGYGKTTEQEFHKILLSSDRGEAGVSAKAHALFLTDIQYSRTFA